MSGTEHNAEQIGDLQARVSTLEGTVASYEERLSWLMGMFSATQGTVIEIQQRDIKRIDQQIAAAKGVPG